MADKGRHRIFDAIPFPDGPRAAHSTCCRPVRRMGWALREAHHFLDHDGYRFRLRSPISMDKPLHRREQL